MSIHQMHGPQAPRRNGSGVAEGGEPPYDGGMEKRVEKLEEIAEKSAGRLVAIEQDIAVIKSNHSTKADIAELKGATKADISAMVVAMHSDINSQTWKLITFVCSFGTALVAAVYFIATHTK